MAVPRRVLLALTPALAIRAGADGREALWAALRRPGTHALLRHAHAPGGGDPPGFQLARCDTQRLLDEAGRAQARAIGGALRAADLAFDRVLTSRWCRAIETARLLDLGRVEEAAPLDSFFADRALGPARTRQVAALLAGLPPDARMALVTHQVNITALTGVYPASGELLAVRAEGEGRLAVTGRLVPA